MRKISPTHTRPSRKFFWGVMMKRMLCALLFVAALLLLTSCVRPVNRTLLIFVVDLTGSIKEDAQTEALTAIQSVFAQNLLQRGDTLVVIPITDDSLTEAQGHIMRFRLSDQREAYDQDIRRLAQDVERQLREMQAAAMTRPYKRSDILGAAELVAEELDAAKSVAVRKVVFFSDFVQDDVQYDFILRLCTWACSAAQT
jgi:hypothetical protein